MNDQLPDPSAFGLRIRTPKVCKLPDCDGNHHAHGYCHKHYVRWLDHGDPNAVGTPGRHRVGEPGRTLPPTKGRGQREATEHERVVLGAGQREQVKAEATRLVTSSNQVIRAAVARLLAGEIPLPAKAADIPDAAPEEGPVSWIPSPSQVDKLHRLAARRNRVLGRHLDNQQHGRRRASPEAQRLSALVRWAVHQHLNPTLEN